MERIAAVVAVVVACEWITQAYNSTPGKHESPLSSIESSNAIHLLRAVDNCALFYLHTLRKYDPSKVSALPKLQHDPQIPWSFTLVTAPFKRQSTKSGMSFGSISDLYIGNWSLAPLVYLKIEGQLNNTVVSTNQLHNPYPSPKSPTPQSPLSPKSQLSLPNITLHSSHSPVSQHHPPPHTHRYPNITPRSSSLMSAR